MPRMIPKRSNCMCIEFSLVVSQCQAMCVIVQEKKKKMGHVDNSSNSGTRSLQLQENTI